MAEYKVKLTGVQKVLANIRKEGEAAIKRATGGLLAAGFLIEGEAKRRVPVEHGPLRASGYTRMHPQKELTVQIGFSAAYAIFVHENLEQKLKGKPRPSGKGVYWGPSLSGPRFLASAADDNTQKILDIVVRRARQMPKGRR